MKKLLILTAFLFSLLSLNAQTIVKGSGTIYFSNKTSMDLYVPDIDFSSEIAITVDDAKAYTWDRTGSEWVLIATAGTDDQALSLSGTTLTLEDGGNVDLSTIQDGTGTDDQALSLSGTTLTLEDGGNVDLSTIQGTDDQALSLSGTTLTLEDGGNVDLSTIQDGTGTDDQALSLSGTTLTLEDGGNVDLSTIQFTIYGEFDDDADAAGGGVPVGGYYILSPDSGFYGLVKKRLL